MRILILSQWCFPEPDLKALTFAKELVRRGHRVQILTGFPNYPGGKLYPGYRIKLFQREVIDTIEILRVPLYPSHDRSGFKRILNYLSFGISAALIGVFKVRKADVMYVYHPPPTIAIAAFTLKLFRGIPIVYDIQDMWPDTLKATGMINSKFVLGLVDRYMKMCYKRFDHITVLSKGFKDLLLQRKVKQSKVSVIYNWSNPIELPKTAQYDFKLKTFGKKFTILFAGTIGVLQGLDVVLEAALSLERSGHTDVQFVILGDGIDLARLKETASKQGISNVLFLGRVTNDEVGKYLTAADALLIHLVNDELFKITVPSKTQAYLLAGKPILAGVTGDASEIVEEAGAGLSFEPENHTDLVKKVIELQNLSHLQLDEMGKNGSRFYHEHLSITVGTDAYETLFGKIAQQDR